MPESFDDFKTRILDEFKSSENYSSKNAAERFAAVIKEISAKTTLQILEQYQETFLCKNQ